MNARCSALVAVLLLLAAGCSSSDEEGGAGQSAQSKAESEPAVQGESQVPARVRTGDAQTSRVQTGVAIDPAEMSKVAKLEPDEAIARYRQECNAADQSPRCRALRHRVEYLYLDSLLTLRRAGKTLDPQLYRVAARAENPALAIVGLRGLMLVKGLIAAEDQQLITAAMDSPYPGVRHTVMQFGARVPGVAELSPRIVSDPDAYAGLAFLDDSLDAEPDPAVIGSYPGARFRYFASDATRHWFTTRDAPEKVIAFLTRSGGEALTGDELKAKGEAEAQQAYMKAAMSGDQAKIMEVMKQMAVENGVDWAQMLDDVSDTGEIRFIKLAPNHVVAVFADNVLHATSIVAPEPPPAPDLAAVMIDSEDALDALQETIKREELAGRILER
jgi:hypothetical protein